MTFRQATMDDLPYLHSLVSDFCNEAGLLHKPKAVATLIVSYLNSPHHFCELAFNEVDVAGVFMAFLDVDVFTHQVFGQDRLMFVRPKYRNKEYSHQMYNHFLSWAKERHCAYVVFQSLCSKDNEQFARVLERLHCSRKGVLMIRYL